MRRAVLCFLGPIYRVLGPSNFSWKPEMSIRLDLDWTGSELLQILLNLDWIRCQAKFLTCEISDFTTCTHAQSNILHSKYADKSDY